MRNGAEGSFSHFFNLEGAHYLFKGQKNQNLSLKWPLRSPCTPFLELSSLNCKLREHMGQWLQVKFMFCLALNVLFYWIKCQVKKKLGDLYLAFLTKLITGNILSFWMVTVLWTGWKPFLSDCLQHVIVSLLSCLPPAHFTKSGYCLPFRTTSITTSCNNCYPLILRYSSSYAVIHNPMNNYSLMYGLLCL